MAAAAELAPQLDQNFDWQFAENQFFDQSTTYQVIDEIPEVAAGRSAVREAARAVLEQRRNNIATGHENQNSLIPIDALSAADAVLTASKTYGPKSAERKERWDGLVLDCHRLVAEWYRKKKPEYFPPVRHVLDPDTEEFFSHGRSVSRMTENAIVPIDDDHEEEDRRINEHVEDATPRLVRKLGAIAVGKSIRTISECTVKAINDYAADQVAGRPHRGYKGYVPEIEKVMLRDIWLDEYSPDRFEEQIGVPGIYFTHEIIKETLTRRGAKVGHMDKTELHGAQLLVEDDLLDFVKDLDEVASEQWCTEIFMGEEVAKGTIKNYETFREEALQRQDGLKDLAVSVASFVLDLAETKMDRRDAPILVEDYVKLRLAELGKDNFAVAEQMFDTKTAVQLQEVVRLEAQGYYEAATELMNETVKAAPGGGACGAGSCGLEAVALNDANGLKATSLGLTEGKLLHDKVRVCPNCHKKTIYYDKKNKACINCEHRKINGVVVEGKKDETK